MKYILTIACWVIVPSFVLAAESELQPLTLQELKNATYKGLQGLPSEVTLVNGQWEGSPYSEGGASRPQVLLVGDTLLSGDLNGDREDEAVVFLNVSTGGSGQLLHLAVLSRMNGATKNIATGLVGDRIQVRDASIENQRVSLDVVRAGKNDALCCPGEVTRMQWSLDGQSLILQPLSETPQRLTLETIGNVEWLLLFWARNEPALPDLGITLTYKDGRFAGKAGCNSYFADAKSGETPGDVIVGLPGSTKMACEQMRMEADTKFLSQMQQVRKFGFLIGKLALNYEGDGTLNTMLFEERSP